MPTWKITLLLSRQRSDGPRTFQSFPMDVDPDEYVLDAVERVWAVHDRTLTFRHACHHSTCGACGMLVNGSEKLTCITPIRSVTRDGATLRVEPLRNFPVLSDLVVDMSRFYSDIEKTGQSQVAQLSQACLPFERAEQAAAGDQYERLVDCLECGMCISACPAANTSDEYLGPAIMAAAHHAHAQTGQPALLDLVDCKDGAWRCHSAFECSAVCPSNVDPAWRIMSLRRSLAGRSLRRLFGAKE